MDGVCIIFLLGAITYSSSSPNAVPNPLNNININLNIGKGKNEENDYESSIEGKSEDGNTNGNGNVGSDNDYGYNGYNNYGYNDYGYNKYGYRYDSKEIQLHLGGPGNPKVIVTTNGVVCQSVRIPDVPQSWGELGRIGSYVTAWDENAMVCGGYSGSGPPFSIFKDCQILHLDTKAWSLGPQLVNFTSSRPSQTIARKFYIFGGEYPTNPGPVPTIWKHHDIIQKLDLDNLQEGWHVVEEIMDVPNLPDVPSTLVDVSSKFFPNC